MFVCLFVCRARMIMATVGRDTPRRLLDLPRLVLSLGGLYLSNSPADAGEIVGELIGARQW